ncbi:MULTISPECIES: HEPN domain-containing protein [unclassified Luteococcus]|uniref:HEPN domain-containing protein n=1 Tax=unclassified Luteococcus TaxID=2639923 RepID=UPI00313D5F4E
MSAEGTPAAVASLSDDIAYMEVLLSADPSALAALGRIAPKVLLIAAASALEDQVKEELQRLARAHGHAELAECVTRGILARGYHTLFEWDKTNANRFFALFGPDAKERCQAAVGADEALDRSVRAFLELGRLRNNLVHNNYVTFEVPKTVLDIVELYEAARVFPTRFGELLFLNPQAA